MLQQLDRAAVRRWAAAAVDVLVRHRAEIDAINVYPVADADTGTNLLQTMRAAHDELNRAGGRTERDALDALARGALLGARGNSGLVLSQLLRGLAQAGFAAPDGPLTAAGLAHGLRLGASLATLAFATPVAGTALTVLTAAADAAHTAGPDELVAVADAAVAGAVAALADTPHQLPELARAGVVDAGGRGVVVLLEALAAVVAQRPPDAVPLPRVARTGGALRSAREAGDSGAHEYEVMYLLEGATDEGIAVLRAELGELGDSVAIAGDGTAWTVHVHCTDVGAAIEAGLDAGRPHRITVIRFADQVAAAPPPRLTVARAVVAVAAGEGMAQLLRGEGAAVCAASEVGVPVAAPDLLAAIAGTRAAHVVVLPNSADGTAVAEAAAVRARDAGHDVVVIPTSSPVQGLAALAVHDPTRRAGDDVVAMAEAAGATRWGELVVATQEALTWAGRCTPGDVLGLVAGEVVLIVRDVTDAGCALVARMLGAGGELVTALLGADAPDGLGDALAAALRHDHPEVELAVYHGGQPGSPLLVGVE